MQVTCHSPSLVAALKSLAGLSPNVMIEAGNRLCITSSGNFIEAEEILSGEIAAQGSAVVKVRDLACLLGASQDDIGLEVINGRLKVAGGNVSGALALTDQSTVVKYRRRESMEAVGLKLHDLHALAPIAEPTGGEMRAVTVRNGFAQVRRVGVIAAKKCNNLPFCEGISVSALKSLSGFDPEAELFLSEGVWEFRGKNSAVGGVTVIGDHLDWSRLIARAEPSLDFDQSAILTAYGATALEGAEAVALTVSSGVASLCAIQRAGDQTEATVSFNANAKLDRFQVFSRTLLKQALAFLGPSAIQVRDQTESLTLTALGTGKVVILAPMLHPRTRTPFQP